MTTTPKRVLLVEDDRFLRRACEASLQQRGFDVRTATDGEEGLALAISQPFDIILLDLLMPKKPGIEVLAALKSNAPTARIPVLILSNSSRRPSRWRRWRTLARSRRRTASSSKRTSHSAGSVTCWRIV